MKKALWLVLQTVLLVVANAVGFFLQPFHLTRTLAAGAAQTRTFTWDGMVLMLVVFVIVVGIEAAAKRLRTAGALSTVALVLATCLALLMKFGFATHDRF